MKMFLKTAGKIFFVGCLVVFLSGCTLVLQKGRRSDMEKLTMTQEQLRKLEQAYVALEKSLGKEIGEKKVRLGIEARGLVVSIVESVLFDSGKAKLRPEAYKTLDKVAKVCRRVVADREIGIEGHTDNQPIKYSGWKSNWELSTARATSVLHYMTGKGISGERLSATGFGEYRPLATNKTTAGQQENRRVEIVILPGKVSTRVK